AGAPEEGQTLSVVQGEWSNAPTSLAEQWARCNAAGYGCVPIAGATGSSYKLAAADTGSSIRVQESAVNGAGEGPPAASAPTSAIGSNVPSITAFSPSSGITGSELTIEGSALASVTEVKLGKLAASFTVVSPSKLEAIVPDGAKAGKVAIVAPGAGAVTKAKFTPTLSLVSFSPKHGAAGKLVKVKGIGFTPSSSVSFGGVAAGSVTFVSAKQLDATVPAGATSAQITVTNTAAPVGTVESAAAFVVL
ncbi:MAG TPA: IPT/TIG domain-containing protein, partial [Solirubrobacteraceae bacterium]